MATGVRISSFVALSLALMPASGCGRESRPPARGEGAPSATAPAASELRVPAARRIVAIGDLHGDIGATRAALRLAGAVDDRDRWIGGDLVLVQTGDQLDRGDGEREIVDLFDRLAEQAKAAGGAAISLNGNHEMMNVALDFRYVTRGGHEAFADHAARPPSDPRLGAAVAGMPEHARGRAAAFAPGGPYAMRLAARHLVAIVGDNAFVHGGLMPKHVKYGLDTMDAEVKSFMAGKAPALPSTVTAEDGPVWLRRYSAAPDPEDCKVLDETLKALGARRMIVGHTVQRNGINPACGGKVWRIDVGLAAHYGGPTEVLEIAGDEVRVVKASDPPSAAPADVPPRPTASSAPPPPGAGASAAAASASVGASASASAGAADAGVSVEEVERAAQRIARAKAQRQALREKLTPLLAGRPMDDALRIELEVHARRAAALARIVEVARAAGDAASEARAKGLSAREKARHDEWIASFAAKLGGR